MHGGCRHQPDDSRRHQGKEGTQRSAGVQQRRASHPVEG